MTIPRDHVHRSREVAAVFVVRSARSHSLTVSKRRRAGGVRAYIIPAKNNESSVGDQDARRVDRTVSDIPCPISRDHISCRGGCPAYGVVVGIEYLQAASLVA